MSSVKPLFKFAHFFAAGNNPGLPFDRWRYFKPDVRINGDILDGAYVYDVASVYPIKNLRVGNFFQTFQV
jgi:hypothetical protein